MTTRDEAIKAVAGVLSTKQNSIEWQTAMLGDGHGTVSTGDNTVYCRLTANSSVVEVLNYRVAPVDGLLVRIAKTPEMPLHWQVIGQADQRVDEGSATVTGGVIYNTPPHHLLHEYLGVDQVNVDWRQINTLRVYVVSGFIIGVLAGLLPRPGADLVVPTQTLDLSASVPASGARYTLISVDAAGSIVATDGTAASGLIDLTLGDIPDTPAGNFRLAAVRLYAGQSAISESLASNDIRDLRWPQERLASAISIGDLALTDGHIVVGNASNTAAEVEMSGDATLDNTGQITLATVNATTGTFGDAITVPQVTVNAKGLITSVIDVPITFPAVSGEVLMADGVTPPDPLLTDDSTDWLYEDSSDAVTGGGGTVTYIPPTVPTDLYIATTGNDTTGDGTSGTPYATLAKALSVLPDTISSDCIIHVADGTYSEAMDLQRFDSPANVVLKIEGNGTTPANVVFNGTVTYDGATQIGLIRGPIRLEIEGVTFAGTADSGLVLRDKSVAILDRVVISTSAGRGLYLVHYARAEIQGGITVSGFSFAGIDAYQHCEVSVTSAGTVSVTGNGTTSWGIHIAYQSMMVVEWVTGVNIEVYDNLVGVQLGIHGVFQHYAATGTVVIDNDSTPSNSHAVECTDLSTWSTNQAFAADNFTYAFYVTSMSYAEAISSRTLTNIGTTSYTFVGGTVYLP